VYFLKVSHQMHMRWGEDAKQTRTREVESKMGLVIETNAAAFTVVSAALGVTQRTGTATSQVSANSHAESARSVAIDFDFTAHIQSAKIAFRNALEAQGVIGTSEGAHEFLEKVLQQARGVIVQSPTAHNPAQIPEKGFAQYAPAVKDMASLAKTQILQQAPTAVHAQANASRQNVLGLLQS
jgi:flagellin-like hook-associated protein FlgL